MTQPSGPSWDPNAPGGQPPPGQSFPPGQNPPPSGYGAPPPGYAQQPGYPPPGYQGYQQQQGYQPPGGYPPPPGGYGTPGAPPPGYANSEEKTYALIAHFGGALGAFITGGVLGFVGGLIALLVKGNQSPTVREHAKSALNFFIPLSGLALILFIAHFCFGQIFGGGVMDLLVGLAFDVAQFAVWVVAFVFGIVGGLKANEGVLYRYPFTMPIIK